MNFMRLIRLPNLLIVALTQYLLQYAILIPELAKIHISPHLPHFPFFLLVVSTVLIAAGGYIINDIEDIEIDRLNKPLKKQIVGRVYPLSISWLFYGFFTVLGFLISLYLAFYINNFLQLVIYPLAVALLWAYSKWFKRQPLLGNLVVSFFCAFVAWVVFYAQAIAENNSKYLNFKTFCAPTINGFEDDIDRDNYQISLFIFSIFLGYAVFAFISTLFREIIKDIEDAEGDKAGNCLTLPIVLGLKRSKGVTCVIGVFFLFLVIYFSFFHWNSSEILRGSLLKIILLNATISLPIFYALVLLIKAKTKEDFSFLSKIAKLIMLSGIVFILIMKL